MSYIICTEIKRNKKGSPISYVLYNRNRKEYKIVKKEDLKVKMKDGLKIENLILTSDNKIREIELKKNIIPLYHGSQNKKIVLEYGKGEDKHDYGRGFYLTPNIELAKEWAIGPNNSDGYLHYYELDLTGLKVLDFDNLSVLNWIAELMAHRDADSSTTYKKNSKIFISKYKIDTTGYDVIKGWRADASYFYIAKQFVRNNINISLLDILLKQGDLGIQVCLKSQKAFKQIKEIRDSEIVDAGIYGAKYSKRDKKARENMTKIIESDENTLDNRFFDILKELI